METIWNEVLVLPAGSPPGARMVTAQPDDGGELRAGAAFGPQGVKVLEIGYNASVELADASEEITIPLARWPTLEEIYSAMEALLEPGAVVTMSLISGQDRDGPLKVLTLTQVGKVVPGVSSNKGNIQ